MNLRRDVFQAIADPTRRAILLLLASQTMTAWAIAANFDTARPTVSKHLQILTECELLTQEQNGREIYYHINAKNMKENNMEQKTKINAEDGKQDLVITREFDLPVDLLFKAHTEPEIIEQVMTNPYTTAKLLKFEGKKHGNYQLESTDAQGKVVFRANGVIHDFVPDEK